MNVPIVSIILLTLFMSTNTFSSPSFNCHKATTNIERTICKNPDIAFLDSVMDSIYKTVIEVSPNREGIQIEQLEWLDARPGNEQALKKAYDDRIQELTSALNKFRNELPDSLEENKAFTEAAQSMVFLGGKYGEMGDFQKELELCQKALSIDPRLPEAYINLGSAQAGLQKWEESRQSFLTGYNLASAKKDQLNQTSASYSLSNYYLASQNADNKQAIHWADICIGHVPKVVVEGGSLSDGFGGIFRKDNSRLFQYYESATMNKAGAYGNMRNFKMAKSILRDFLKKYPDSQDVKSML